MAADEDDDETIATKVDPFDSYDPASSSSSASYDPASSSSSASYDQDQPRPPRTVLPFPMTEEARDVASGRRRRELIFLAVILAALVLAFDWRR